MGEGQRCQEKPALCAEGRQSRDGHGWQAQRTRGCPSPQQSPLFPSALLPSSYPYSAVPFSPAVTLVLHAELHSSIPSHPIPHPSLFTFCSPTPCSFCNRAVHRSVLCHPPRSPCPSRDLGYLPIAGALAGTRPPPQVEARDQISITDLRLAPAEPLGSQTPSY